jgi:large subunit ribosomal protein L35
MPKMKSHSGAKKRFKVTGTGKVQARHSFSSHILEKKSPKRKRHMQLDINLVKGDEKIWVLIDSAKNESECTIKKFAYRVFRSIQQ